MTQPLAGSMPPNGADPNETGSESTGTAVERAKDATGEVRDQAGQVVGDVKTQAQHLLARTKDEAAKEASSRASQLAETLHGVAGELRTMADADQDGRLAGVVGGAADRAHRFADHLDQRGVEGVVDDIKRGVRRRPGLVLAAAVASGFIVGRLVREGTQATGNRRADGDGRDAAGEIDTTTHGDQRTPTTTPERPAGQFVTEPSAGYASSQPGSSHG